MTVKPTLLSERALMLAKIETVRGTDPLPTTALDAFLVGAMDIQLDTTVLERDIYSPSFSPVPSGVGRKLANVSFTHEIKSSGDVGITRPRLGTLLRACGMRELLVTAGAANQIEDFVTFGAVNGPLPVMTKDVVPTQRFGSYLIECVTGGASLTAAVQVSRWNNSDPDATVMTNTRIEADTNFSAVGTLALDNTDKTAPFFTVGGAPVEGDEYYAVVGGQTFKFVAGAAPTPTTVGAGLEALITADAKFTAVNVAGVVTITYTSGAAPVVLTSGTTSIVLGDSGAEVGFTWTGDLVEGQKWIVNLYETGYMYRPVTGAAASESLTIYMYRDSALHRITACQGTVTFTGDAGNLASASFEFTGNYIEPVTEPLPTDAVTEQTQPAQVELAQMSIRGDQDYCAQSFTYTLGNTISPKDCLNASDGYDGSNITGREPTASSNPEASTEIYSNMWGDFSAGTEVPLHTRVGIDVGNIVRFYADRATYTGLNYGDRNGSLTLEPAFQLNGLAPAGDDELRIAFV